MIKINQILFFVSLLVMTIGVWLVFNNDFPRHWDANDKVGFATQYQTNAMIRYIIPGFSLILTGGILMFSSLLFLKERLPR